MENYNTGFTTNLIDQTNEFYKIALEQFSLYKRLEGITVQVERIKDNSKYKKVFGSLYNSNNLNDTEVESFPYVVLIQINDMKKLFLKQVDQIDFYDNQYTLRKGDTLKYSHGTQQFQFKISEVENFSDVDNILYHYTLVGAREQKVIQ